MTDSDWLAIVAIKLFDSLGNNMLNVNWLKYVYISLNLGVGATGKGDFTSAIDMRNKKYAQWAALAEKHENIVTVR